MLYCDLYGRVPPLSLKLFVVIIRAINRQKARYLWLLASKWQSTVQVALLLELLLEVWSAQFELVSGEQEDAAAATL